MLSRRFAAAVTIVIVLAFVVIAIAPAFAAPLAGALPQHARLVASAPADRSSVDTVDQVVLTFNESVNPDFVAIRVQGPNGASGEADGTPTVEGVTVNQPLTSSLAAGEHTVTYRVVSADGHPISGTVTFTTTASSTAPPPTSNTAEPSPSETSPTASATPTASESLAPTAEPAAEGKGTSRWVAVVIALGVAALAAVAGGAWQRRRAGHPHDAQG